MMIESINSISNGFVKHVLRELKSLTPTVFKSCPLSGKIEIENMPPLRYFANMLPTGVILSKTNFYEESDGNENPVKLNVSIVMIISK